MTRPTPAGNGGPGGGAEQRARRVAVLIATLAVTVGALTANAITAAAAPENRGTEGGAATDDHGLPHLTFAKECLDLGDGERRFHHDRDNLDEGEDCDQHHQRHHHVPLPPPPAPPPRIGVPEPVTTPAVTAPNTAAHVVARPATQHGRSGETRSPGGASPVVRPPVIPAPSRIPLIAAGSALFNVATAATLAVALTVMAAAVILSRRGD